MGLRFSTRVSSDGTQCISPVLNTALMVTNANAAAASSAGNELNWWIGQFSDKIRCTGEGILRTFEDIHDEFSGTIPSAGNSVTVSSNVNLKVKRPNCLCTDLVGYKLYQEPSGGPSLSSIKRITFDDGFQYILGSFNALMTVNVDGIEGIGFTKVGDLIGGEKIVACMSPGKTSDVSVGCKEITAISNSPLAAGTKFFYQTNTNYPRANDFPTSYIRSSIMLENGVYVFSIPSGGTY